MLYFVDRGVGLPLCLWGLVSLFQILMEIFLSYTSMLKQAKAHHNMTPNTNQTHDCTHRAAPSTRARRPPGPRAPPRWERDEEMEQPEGEAERKHVWEVEVVHARGVSHFPGRPRPSPAL